MTIDTDTLKDKTLQIMKEHNKTLVDIDFIIVDEYDNIQDKYVPVCLPQITEFWDAMALSYIESCDLSLKIIFTDKTWIELHGDSDGWETQWEYKSPIVKPTNYYKKDIGALLR